MARHLDDALLGAQDALNLRHAEWKAELQALFDGVMGPVAASTGVVAPEGGRDPHPWESSMLEELRVKEPQPGWMLQAAQLSPPKSPRCLWCRSSGDQHPRKSRRRRQGVIIQKM